MELQRIASGSSHDDMMDDEDIPESSGSDLSSRMSGVMNRISGILSKTNEDDDEDDIDEVFLRRRHTSDSIKPSDSSRSPHRMSETTRKVMEARKSQHS